MGMENSIDRWVHLLRLKAQEYEHCARAEGKEISCPDIDSICNEMLAFKDGAYLKDNRNKEIS